MGEPNPTAEEGMKALADLFSNGVNPCKSSGRTYVLELKDGKLVFRRDEICLAIENAINQVYGLKPDYEAEGIVPQKLARLFPARSRRDVGRQHQVRGVQLTSWRR